MVSLAEWDGAEYLDDKKMIAELLKLAMAKCNKEYLVSCFDCAMRARNINRLAKWKKIFEMPVKAKETKTTLVRVAKAFISKPVAQAAC